MRRFVTVLAASFLVASCATAIDPVTLNVPLKRALTEPVETLETNAATGDRQAQYAVSFLALHGLRGVARDPLRAEGLRAQAGVDRSTTQPIYVPGVNGRPGSLIYAQHASPGISDHEARRLDLCAMALVLGQPALGGQLCGSPEAYVDLLPGAQALRAEMMTASVSQRPQVDPASVTACSAIDSLWSDAAQRMAANDTAGAAAAADRIIALCGEGEASWHARVMRATLALDDDDSALALGLMAPVPSPPPAPIGAYGELVRIAALSGAGREADAATARTALAAASHAALTEEAERDRRGIVAHPLGAARLVIFERPRQSFPGIFSVKTIVVDGEPARLEAYQVTRHGAAANLENVWFLDAFDCQGRATVEVFDSEPSAEALAERIARYRADTSAAITGSRPVEGAQQALCRWPVQVAPGLGDDMPVRIEYSGPPVPQ